MKKINIIIKYLILTLVAFSMLAPFFYMIMLSFTPNDSIFSSAQSSTFGEMLHNLTIENYKHVFTELPIARYFINSLIVATITTIGQVFISALAGYGFARLKFKGSEAIFFIILVTMMIPPQVNIVPLFFIMREMNLIDTYQSLIIPGFFGGFGIFMFRQFFLTFPKEIEESSKIDGCTPFSTFFKIALPLSIPTIAALSIFTFVSSWNSFMWPLIVTNSDKMRTLPLGLAAFKGSFREITLWGDLFACAVICAIPTIIIFLLGKKYFINDIMQGGVKE